MKLEQQVCSLKLAKKLKELGVERESYFYWTKRTDKKQLFVEEYIVCQGKMPENDDEFPAFTVAELGEMIPRRITDQDQTLSGVKGKSYYLTLSFYSDDYSNENLTTGWSLNYIGTKVEVCSDTLNNSAGIYYTGTMADVYAKMLIYLLENNLIKL